jgi:peptide/nickel transport system substrate-binding protein
MALQKTIRYYYWLSTAFIRKHIKHILLSFLLSFIVIIVIITLTPYLETLLLTEKLTVGLTGRYQITSLPEDITAKISNGLIFINEKGDITPSLADRWQFDKEGRQYTFHLKNNLYWNNGDLFTAKDIKYDFVDVKTIVVDDQTITFVLDKPLPIFPTYLRRPILKYPLTGISGLYKAENVRTEYGYVKSLSLIPNKNGLPSITYKFYDNESQLVTAYKRGEITEMQLTKQSIADDFTHWKNSVVEKNVDYTRLMTLFFNMNKPIWKDANAKDVRQAVERAINQDMFKKIGVEAIGSINPLSWAYTADLKKNVYDPNSAEKILKKLKEASGSAQLNFKTSYDYYDIADEIVQNLKTSGMDIDINFVSSNDQGDFDMLLAFWRIPLDPDQYYFWHSSQIGHGKGNISGYNRPKVDLLLEQGRRTKDVAERKRIYYDLERVLLDDPPALFLYYPYVFTVKRK